jgi:hypothetical protein
MGRLLDRLLETSPDYDIRRADGGFVLTRRPGRDEAFSALARDAANRAGDDCLIFSTRDGAGYSQIFVVPLDDLR